MAFASDWSLPLHSSDTEGQTAHAGAGGPVPRSRVEAQAGLPTAARKAKRQGFQKRMRTPARAARRY